MRIQLRHAVGTLTFIIGAIAVLCMLLYLGVTTVYDRYFAVDDLEYAFLMSIADQDDPAIRLEGFVNMGGDTIKTRGDAVNAAKRELKPDFTYAYTSVGYDEDMDIWDVGFHTKEGGPGSATVVYMTGDGKTIRMLDRQ